ncbi:hypothetical protein EPUS_08847 [Endocarpon pusillum Z07020]|uniref:Uncharacterized protein n=1 Tax=Endocarpon pusillum (strain Z07020 / HMAS-L-300199) TaxID=1263415 RepID=U1HR77_ENDPU|nr:uncharacterized protein EPUS_08847 [Endocarpon pusillum Z07020]ERF72990.1 hypothetical protein EPUS_08847 [Endocarpon pusillum Z07020]
MKSRFVLLNSLVPIEEIRPGGLVSELLSPQTNAFAGNLPPESTDVYIDENDNFGVLLANSSEGAFRSNLTKLLRTSSTIGNEESVQLSSARSRSIELRQPRKVFIQLCKSSEVRQWLEDGVREGAKSYLVVGFPVSTIASGGADILGLGAALDVGVGADHSRSHSDSVYFHARGEKVWAIRYQKISFKLFKHRSTETAYLEKPRWVMLSKNRAASTGEEEVELDLDDLEQDDIEENGLVNSKLKGSEGNESYFYSRDNFKITS